LELKGPLPAGVGLEAVVGADAPVFYSEVRGKWVEDIRKFFSNFS
jgi:hypothetical protein